MFLLHVTFVASYLIALVSSYPNGPPISACQSMTPGHGADPQPSPAPYTITVNAASYNANTVVEVTVRATGEAFRGVFVQARRMCGDMDTAVGTFSLEQGEEYLQLLACNGNTGSAVGHSNREETMNKTFSWIAPSQTLGDIYFRGTFVQTFNTFWTGVSSPVLMDSTQPNSTCPDTTPMADTTTVMVNSTTMAYTTTTTSTQGMTQSTTPNGSGRLMDAGSASLLILCTVLLCRIKL